MDEIPGSVVTALIRAGNDPDLDSPRASNVVSEFRKSSELGMRRSGWSKVCFSLSAEEICALLRALVIAERELGWTGGSASSVIWVFRLLKSRDYEAADRLSAWIIPRTQNPYVPFGHSTYDVRSLGELGAALNAHEKAKRLRALQVAADVAEAKVRKLERMKAAAEHDARSLARRIDREQRVLDALSLEPPQWLEFVALDPMPIDYWPSDLADVEDSVLDALPRELIGSLMIKLRGPRAPHWRRFRQRLASRNGTSEGLG